MSSFETLELIFSRAELLHHLFRLHSSRRLKRPALSNYRLPLSGRHPRPGSCRAHTAPAPSRRASYIIEGKAKKGVLLLLQHPPYHSVKLAAGRLPCYYYSGPSAPLAVTGKRPFAPAASGRRATPARRRHRTPRTARAVNQASRARHYSTHRRTASAYRFALLLSFRRRCRDDE